MGESPDSFRKLDEKVSRLVELFKQSQEEKRVLQQELDQLPAEFKARARRCDTLERDLQAFGRDRDEVRSRIERLLEQIDLLTKPDAE